MNIAIPVEENKGLESPVHGHFGSAPMFLLIDSETMGVEVLNNSDQEHVHGMCNPLKTLGARKVDAVIVSGIGTGALLGFRGAGIRVFHSSGRTVADAVSLLIADRLVELDQQASCTGHNAAGGCHHT